MYIYPDRRRDTHHIMPQILQISLCFQSHCRISFFLKSMLLKIGIWWVKMQENRFDISFTYAASMTLPVSDLLNCEFYLSFFFLCDLKRIKPLCVDVLWLLMQYDWNISESSKVEIIYSFSIVQPLRFVYIKCQSFH